MGHDPEFINLRPTTQRETYRIINRNGIHRVYELLHYCQLRRRYKEFERFINHVLPMGTATYCSTEDLAGADLHYDAYLCGGDQIWNPSCQDFETAYYLQFLSPDSQARRIAYSPSLGKNKFDPEVLQNIKKWLLQNKATIFLYILILLHNIL